MSRGGQDSLSLWRAARWSAVVAAMLVIPYDALRIYYFLYEAPERGVTFVEEGPLETAEQRLEVAARVVMALPFLLAVFAIVLFIIVLAPIFLLGRIVRRYLLLPLPPPGGSRAGSP